MNTEINIERVESGPAWADRSSEKFDGYIAERQAEAQAEQQQALNAACEAIHKIDLSESEALEQLLATLGCRAASCGYSESDVQAIDDVAGCLCGVRK